MLGGLLSGCGSNSDHSNNPLESPPLNNTVSEENTEANKEVEEITDRTLTDPLGHELTIPAKPQRVLASYLEDYLVALDELPIVQCAIGETPMMYLQSELAGVPYIPYDLPFEAVINLDTDLIIIGDESLIADDKYASYNKIAPTYALGTDINNDWRQALLTIGEVLNKKDAAKAVLTSYEDKLADAKVKLAQALDAKESVIAIWLVGKTFWVVNNKQSSGDVMYNDLGFAVPELVQTVSKGDGGIWRSASLEALAQLDADHIFLINSDTQTGSEALKDPIWSNIPAVKNGHVYEFSPNSSWLYTGPIANSQMIDHILNSIIK